LERIFLGATKVTADFSAWPRGLGRSGPLLDALCTKADSERAVITAKAGNKHLYQTLYEPRGLKPSPTTSAPRQPLRAGARFERGKLIERETEETATEAA